MAVNTAGICSVCGMQMPSVGLVTHVCGGTPTYIATPAPVCEKCGHMEHPDGECCWPLRRGPAGYVHKHCNCGGKRTPTPAPDLSPCPCNQPSDTTHARAEHAPDDEMRPEYDFREGERGKYFERYNAPPAPERMSKEEFERIASLFHIPDRWSSAHQYRRLPRGWAVARDLLAEARRARGEEKAWFDLASGYKHRSDAATARAERAEAEVAALKGMIAYALEAPDAEATKTILTDALDGVTGADNVSDVRGERERLRAEVERLRAALTEIVETVRDPRLIAREALGDKP